MLFKLSKGYDAARDRKLTRFDRDHMRDAGQQPPPGTAPFGNPDPSDNLTRIAHRHSREPLRTAPDDHEPLATAQETPPAGRQTPPPGLSMQLHSDAPISVDILRRALPRRFAERDA